MTTDDKTIDARVRAAATGEILRRIEEAFRIGNFFAVRCAVENAEYLRFMPVAPTDAHIQRDVAAWFDQITPLRAPTSDKEAVGAAVSEVTAMLEVFRSAPIKEWLDELREALVGPADGSDRICNLLSAIEQAQKLGMGTVASALAQLVQTEVGAPDGFASINLNLTLTEEKAKRLEEVSGGDVGGTLTGMVNEAIDHLIASH